MTDKQHVALTRCYFCGESDRILLATRYNQKGEPLKDLGPMHGKVVDMEPCPQCKEYMEQGVILIGIDDAKSEPNWFKERIPNPYRTGAWSVIKEEAFDRLPLCGPEADRIKEFAKKQRFMFVEHQVLVNLGIVKEKPDEGEMQQSGGVPEEVPGS